MGGAGNQKEIRSDRSAAGAPFLSVHTTHLNPAVSDDQKVSFGTGGRSASPGPRPIELARKCLGNQGKNS